MKKIIKFFLFTLTLGASLGWAYGLPEWDMLQSVLKIKVYGQDSISKNYIYIQYGSAVAIDSKRIITNAHVVVNAYNGLPTGMYEICRSKPDGWAPVCFTTARLISYDSVADLAVLELSTPITGIKKMTFQEKSMSIWSNTIVYGYPAIGGESITRTEWKIGGLEGENYKFDGTIDHGNSGGGAFDTKGNLVGIPYGANSDNGVIGYIIPYSTVKKFLSGKTDNIEKYKYPISTDFKSYIWVLQSLSKNPNLIATKYVNIKDLGKNGFSLVGAVESRDGKIFDYRFINKTNRVLFIASCSRDAYSSTKSESQIISDSIAWYTQSDANLSINEIQGKEDAGLHIIFTKQLVEKNGEKPVALGIVNEKTPNCSIWIFANDIKKDASIYMKALDIGKKVQFSNIEPKKAFYESSFYKNYTIPDKLYISETTQIDSMIILPKIWTFFGPNFHTDSQLKIYTMRDLNGYMNIGYDKSLYYKWKDFSFEAFIKRFIVTDDPKIVETIYTTKNGKKFILSYINPTDDNQSRLIFTYPFKTESGDLKLYQYEFNSPIRNDEFEWTIRAFFENTELPGTSPFPN